MTKIKQINNWKRLNSNYALLSEREDSNQDHLTYELTNCKLLHSSGLKDNLYSTDRTNRISSPNLNESDNSHTCKQSCTVSKDC